MVDAVSARTRRIVVVSGSPGAGKTTLARRLASLLGMSLIAKDDIKESIWDALGPPEGDLGWSRRVGGAAMEVLWTLAARGSDLVLEANFRPDSEPERARLRALGATVIEVHCWCPPEVAARRYAERGAGAGHHPAHVLPTLSPELLAEFHGPMALGPVIRVDTSGPVDVEELARRVEDDFGSDPFPDRLRSGEQRSEPSP